MARFAGSALIEAIDSEVLAECGHIRCPICCHAAQSGSENEGRALSLFVPVKLAVLPLSQRHRSCTPFRLFVDLASLYPRMLPPCEALALLGLNPFEVAVLVGSRRDAARAGDGLNRHPSRVANEPHDPRIVRR